MPPDYLRKPILLPLAVICGLLVGGALIWAYRSDRGRVDEELQVRASAIERHWTTHMSDDFDMMSAALEAIAGDETLRVALADRDRSALLERARPLFQRLRKEAQVTHLYFTAPDRVNLLRVHKPDTHGDLIDRETTLGAERTGAPARGLEIGPLGTLTLRVVYPWFDEDRLIGYVELGHEMSHMLDVVDRSLASASCPLIRKECLDRQGWQAGMQMMGRPAEWDRFPDCVATRRIPDQLPGELVALLSSDGIAILERTFELETRGRAYRVTSVPLTEVGGRDVGRLLTTFEVTARRAASVRFLLTIGLAGLAASGLVIAFFIIYLSRLDPRSPNVG